jgi:uncharacterized damage-inducible protein DinB
MRRATPPRLAGERDTLVAFLDHQRRTLDSTCAGLTAEQLRRRALPPSGLSLLGLIRHAAEAERLWFQAVLGGEATEPDGGCHEVAVDDADPAAVFAAWHEACARSRAFIAAAESLDVEGAHGADRYSLRQVLTHLIEEYARHNAHAHLLRERLDGGTGG